MREGAQELETLRASLSRLQLELDEERAKVASKAPVGDKAACTIKRVTSQTKDLDQRTEKHRDK